MTEENVSQKDIDSEFARVFEILCSRYNSDRIRVAAAMILYVVVSLISIFMNMSSISSVSIDFFIISFEMALNGTTKIVMMVVSVALAAYVLLMTVITVMGFVSAVEAIATLQNRTYGRASLYLNVSLKSAESLKRPYELLRGLMVLTIAILLAVQVVSISGKLPVVQ